MSKKAIVFLSLTVCAIINSASHNLLRKLNMGIWWDLIILFLIYAICLAMLNFIFKKYKIAGYDESKKIKVDFFPTVDVADHVLKYAVIMTRYNDQWLFVRHKDRTTWEIPGGRREPNEDIIRTAERELVEETGAMSFDLKPVCAYCVTRDSQRTYGLLCYAEIVELGSELVMEIVEVKGYEDLPDALTYPFIQPALYQKIVAYLEAY